jgi:hypothetical protein
MFSFELVYFASFPGARLRLKFFGFAALFAGWGHLWQFKEIAGS